MYVSGYLIFISLQGATTFCDGSPTNDTSTKLPFQVLHKILDSAKPEATNNTFTMLSVGWHFVDTDF